MKLVRITEDTTVDVQNWRRYGTYVRAGQVLQVSDDDAVRIQARGVGKVLQGGNDNAEASVC